MAINFISSVDYHRQNSVEVDLFFRFFSQQYSDQDLMFYLYSRSLAERELNIKLKDMPQDFDVRTKMISKIKVVKISKVYFQNISGGGMHSPEHTDALVNHFVLQLIKGA